MVALYGHYTGTLSYHPFVPPAPGPVNSERRICIDDVRPGYRWPRSVGAYVLVSWPARPSRAYRQLYQEAVELTRASALARSYPGLLAKSDPPGRPEWAVWREA